MTPSVTSATTPYHFGKIKSTYLQTLHQKFTSLYQTILHFTIFAPPHLSQLVPTTYWDSGINLSLIDGTHQPKRNWKSQLKSSNEMFVFNISFKTQQTVMIPKTTTPPKQTTTILHAQPAYTSNQNGNLPQGMRS